MKFSLVGVLLLLYLILPWNLLDVKYLGLNLSGYNYLNIRSYLLLPILIVIFIRNVLKFKMVLLGLTSWCLIAILNLHFTSIQQTTFYSFNLLMSSDVVNLLFISIVYIKKDRLTLLLEREGTNELSVIFRCFNVIVIINALLSLTKVDDVLPWTHDVFGNVRGIWFSSNLIYSVALGVTFIFIFYTKLALIIKCVISLILLIVMNMTDVDTAIYSLIISLFFVHFKFIRKRIVIFILLFLFLFYLRAYLSFIDNNTLNSIIIRAGMLMVYFDLIFSDAFHFIFGFAAGGMDSIGGNNFQFLGTTLYEQYITKWDVNIGDAIFEAMERFSANESERAVGYRIIMPHFGFLCMVINLGFLLTYLIVKPVFKALNTDIRNGSVEKKYYAMIVFLLIFQFFHTFFMIPLIFTLSLLIIERNRILKPPITKAQ